MTYAYERTLGTRRILGTDHPVVAVVYPVADHLWVAATLINGVAQGGTTYRTRKEAVADVETRTEPATVTDAETATETETPYGTIYRSGDREWFSGSPEAHEAALTWEQYSKRHTDAPAE